MKDPALEQKLRDTRFEELQSRHAYRYLFHGCVAVTSVLALLLALFKEDWPGAVFLVLSAAGLTLVCTVSIYLSRRCAFEDMRAELPHDADYIPPDSLL
ncbi:hypothetical protein [Kineobactrum sediminis]|uniref:hypothetical protein n=1 Tax=Kineobactrum sediminis TaxID=1905677 RepID=UPI000C78B68B|nr:hypothetical protein [Kineobactrum sediminis]